MQRFRTALLILTIVVTSLVVCGFIIGMSWACGFHGRISFNDEGMLTCHHQDLSESDVFYKAIFKMVIGVVITVSVACLLCLVVCLLHGRKTDQLAGSEVTDHMTEEGYDVTQDKCHVTEDKAGVKLLARCESDSGYQTTHCV